MAEGRSVKIDGIGTFTASLVPLYKDKEREGAEEGSEHRNAQSIYVGNVNFRVDKIMLRRITMKDADWKEPLGKKATFLTEVHTGATSQTGIEISRRAFVPYGS